MIGPAGAFSLTQGYCPTACATRQHANLAQTRLCRHIQQHPEQHPKNPSEHLVVHPANNAPAASPPKTAPQSSTCISNANGMPAANLAQMRPHCQQHPDPKLHARPLAPSCQCRKSILLFTSSQNPYSFQLSWGGESQWLL